MREQVLLCPGPIIYLLIHSQALAPGVSFGETLANHRARPCSQGTVILVGECLGRISNKAISKSYAASSDWVTGSEGAAATFS